MRKGERHARRLGLRGPYNPSWLLRYYLYRYGHGAAYVILGLACFFALALVVSVQHKQDATAHQLTLLVKNIQIDRRKSAGAICRSTNDLTFQLRALIVEGARSSRPFEKIYRAYGLPRYAERVRRARKQAHRLKVIRCGELIRRIEAQTPPPPGLP